MYRALLSGRHFIHIISFSKHSNPISWFYGHRGKNMYERSLTHESVHLLGGKVEI